MSIKTSLINDNYKYKVLNASHEILTNEIAGKASPASALNHIMHVFIKSIYNITLIAPFGVHGHLGGANKG